MNNKKTKEDKILYILDIINDKSYKKSISTIFYTKIIGIKDKVKELYENGIVNDEYLNKVDDYMLDMFSDFKELIDYNDIKTLMFPIYDEIFNEEEINAAYNFYLTKHGKSFAKKSFNMSPKINEVINKYSVEISKHIDNKRKDGGYGEIFK